jgi:predicted site-specific integrase-resolvase
MEIRKYSIGQFAKLINRTEQTLRNWDKSGKLKPAYVDEVTGYRYYTDEQLKIYNGEKVKSKQTIGYCRVSSQKQKEALDRQIENVKMYMYAKGYQFSIISDIGSGINYQNKGLNKLMSMVLNEEVSKIVILYKDRLVRFGYELIENICISKGVEIEIIDNTERSDEEEIFEDLIQIITVFSCRLQGKRANKTKKIIKELSEDD